MEPLIRNQVLFCSTRIPICEVIRKGWARLAHHHSDAWYIIVALSIFSDRWRKGKGGDGRKERGWEGGIYLNLSRNTLSLNRTCTYSIKSRQLPKATFLILVSQNMSTFISSKFLPQTLSTASCEGL